MEVGFHFRHSDTECGYLKLQINRLHNTCPCCLKESIQFIETKEANTQMTNTSKNIAREFMTIKRRWKICYEQIYTHRCSRWLRPIPWKLQPTKQHKNSSLSKPVHMEEIESVINSIQNSKHQMGSPTKHWSKRFCKFYLLSKDRSRGNTS